MKRALLFAAALPAGVGLTVPAAAQPITPQAQAMPTARMAPHGTGKSVSWAPLNSGKQCSSNGRVCISVIGKRLYVSTVHVWVNHLHTYSDIVDVALIPQYGQWGIWLSRDLRWDGTHEFTWHPDCQWTSSANQAEALDSLKIGHVSVSIHGSATSGLPYCHLR